MKKFLFLLALQFSIQSFSQEVTYKEYSYTEFFQLIENEKDTIFRLENARITYNEKTDLKYLGTLKRGENFTIISKNKNVTSPIVIDKEMYLKNVIFRDEGRYVNDILNTSSLNNIHFKQKVTLHGVYDVQIINCVFFKSFKFRIDDGLIKQLKKYNKSITRTNIDITNSDFRGRIWFQGYVNNELESYIMMSGNDFTFNNLELDNNPVSRSQISGRGISVFYFINNKVIGNQKYLMHFSNIERLLFRTNHLKTKNLELTFGDLANTKELSFIKNTFDQPLFLDIDSFKSHFNLEYNQFKKGFFSYEGLANLTMKEMRSDNYSPLNNKYKNLYISEEPYFEQEIKLKSGFYNNFKANFNTKKANIVYVDIKDLETERMKFEYEQTPNFSTFFKLQINQFLKVFSAYGTKPEKAVIFSMYVILLFAFIYLLFPNSWDAHGRKRIMNRYAFFFTYMNKKSGIHEVYLDNQKEDLLEFDEFKALVTQQGKTVPKFFTATALPLYKWAISGTKFSASVLKRIDIMKGTWNDLPPQKRWWKSFLLIGAFTVAICYDVLIKMLNALMLSINTFTTLGFGEIPIKGLPRYLAIIQGFIGWFMLTIFSVSLISQLLN